ASKNPVVFSWWKLLFVLCEDLLKLRNHRNAGFAGRRLGRADVLADDLLLAMNEVARNLSFDRDGFPIIVRPFKTRQFRMRQSSERSNGTHRPRRLRELIKH